MTDPHQPLVLNKMVLREIAGELHRLFQPYTKNISIHADGHAIQILVFSPAGMPFQTPEGNFDVRLSEDGAQEFLPRRYS